MLANSANIPEAREAIDAINDFTRSQMREDHFRQRLAPRLAVSNDDLDRAVQIDRPVREVDVEEAARRAGQPASSFRIFDGPAPANQEAAGGRELARLDMQPPAVTVRQDFDLLSAAIFGPPGRPNRNGDVVMDEAMSVGAVSNSPHSHEITAAIREALARNQRSMPVMISTPRSLSNSFQRLMEESPRPSQDTNSSNNHWVEVSDSPLPTNRFEAYYSLPEFTPAARQGYFLFNGYRVTNCDRLHVGDHLVTSEFQAFEVVQTYVASAVVQDCEPIVIAGCQRGSVGFCPRIVRAFGDHIDCAVWRPRLSRTINNIADTWMRLSHSLFLPFILRGST